MTSILDLDALHLDKGSHNTPSEGMCLMEAVSYMAGEAFSDHPMCASPVIAAFLRSWQDVLPDDERQQLKPYIPRLIGTRGSSDLEERRSWMALDWLVRVQTPAWLRLAGLEEQATVLESMAEVTATTCPSIKAPLEAIRIDARSAWDAAGAAAWDAAGDAAGAAAWAAAGDAAGAAAGDAAGAAAGAAAWAAARAAARAAAGAAARAAARAAAGAAARAAAGDAAGAAARAAAGDAARDAARAAARARLEPTKRELQARAHDLLERLIAAE